MPSEFSKNILLTPAESRQADALAMEAGAEGLALMEAAGAAVAEITADYIGTPLEAGGEIVVLCGPGNNGGDGFVAARHLDDWGYPVRLMLAGEIGALKGDAAEMARRWPGQIEPMNPKGLGHAVAIIDALFGTGLARPLEGDFAAMIDAANAHDAFKVAVDVPSGLDAATGNTTGLCFAADTTVTFFRRKVGQAVAPGRFLCGGLEHVHVADIGIRDAVLSEIKPQTYLNDPGLWGDSFAFPGPAAHKYLRGHLLVLGGREPTLGASRLASMAGLRVGAGLVTLAAPSETYAIQATALTDIMVRRFDSAFGFMGLLADNRINSVLIGPGAGVGEKTAEIVQDVGRRGRQMVLDADALTSLVGRLDLLTSVKKSEIVLTPHEGEFARLFPSCNPREDRVKAARDAARLAGSVIVLKGASTVVAAPDGRASIAANAPSWLSVAGTGDVLGGMIAGLMAQGMPAFEAASAGVWLHGEAGTEAGRGLVASDLLSCIPSILP
ncbi:NAD(P)H-hydrate dehydratase [Kordiimonas marina]|uniref:NAD(P)H-hydrate dehydratase n=1 Tax=Kordiimonas marina TaxID=2872312 RepID=UPI001FF5FB96|nr:NAD(P)H-hydrate dehydratase [Kordiimonas marina]